MRPKEVPMVQDARLRTTAVALLFLIVVLALVVPRCCKARGCSGGNTRND
jgi:hypothetical protein